MLFRNAGIGGTEYSSLEITETTARYSITGQRMPRRARGLQFETAGKPDVVLNIAQVKQLHEALTVWIKKHKTDTTPIAIMVEGKI